MKNTPAVPRMRFVYVLFVHSVVFFSISFPLAFIYALSKVQECFSSWGVWRATGMISEPAHPDIKKTKATYSHIRFFMRCLSWIRPQYADYISEGS